MSGAKQIRVFWLKFMYGSTVLIAGCIGIGMLILPSAAYWVFGVDCPQILSGLIGSLFLAIGLVSVLGLVNPVKFIPVLFMQLLYKSAWLCFVVLPLLITGKLPVDIIPAALVFLAVVIGDLIAIPFRNIFNNAPETKHENQLPVRNS
jgi:hypothetical protein